MTAPNPDIVQGAFRALADPTRRDILVMLSRQDMTIGEVSDRFAMTRAAVKKHLTVLEQGGLISVQPRGRERINRLAPQGLKTAAGWLGYFNEFWDDRLAALRDSIENEEENNND
jgi:DNA-binding transcriptional ArsR family regulator